MRWCRESITEGEVDALHKAAQRAWSADTRYPIARVSSEDAGQCYVTAYWLTQRLGGQIGRKKGHYAWLSPEGDYVLDLASHTGEYVYAPNTGFKPTASIPNERTRRFANRADEIFDHLGKVLHLSLDYMGDALPASEPDRSSEIAQQKDQQKDPDQYWHDEPGFRDAEGDFQFVYANGALEVSPFHNHEQLLAHTGVGKDYTGPMAMGHIMVAHNQATFEVESNMNVKGLDKIFKDYAKHVGWGWGGITNIEGEPISSEFSPKASSVLGFVYDPSSEHLWLSGNTVGGIAARLAGRPVQYSDQLGRCGSGILRIEGRRCTLERAREGSAGLIESLSEYCQDQGLTLYAGNDNQLKVIPDLQQDNNYDPNPKNPDEHQYPGSEPDYREPSGTYRCPICSRLFPGWDEYSKHRRSELTDNMEENDGHFPEVEESAIQDAHFTPTQPEGLDPVMGKVMPAARHEAERVDLWDDNDKPGDQYFVGYMNGSPVGFARVREGKLWTTSAFNKPFLNRIIATTLKYAEKEPKDMLAAPLPFIYDVEEDNITLGQPGQRTVDISGKFTPGGIIEGVYEPGGRVIIKTLTNMPYSVRHVIDLWYYTHPELSVTGVYLQDDSGKQQKLAANDVGGFISTLVAADPATHAVTKALQKARGNVYVVGGAIRDSLLGKQPRDLDLMVTGLDGTAVQAALRDLPGRTNLTGKDFGVFRYRNGGENVEIALPRREHSTGVGHRDFDVQADPDMRPEEDLWRRDFTANAMAVDLSTGQLVDPYNGARDIEAGVLRTHNPDSLAEDPLRMVRALVANARHGLVPDDDTKLMMARNAPLIRALPPERVQAELDKLFAGDRPADAIRLAHETGVLGEILPEVERCMGYDQNNPHHEYELGEHLTNVLERTAQINPDPDVRLAALLHDIGKPGSQWTDPDTGRSHFYKKKTANGFIGEDHAELGGQMARKLMNRLRYPNDRIARVGALVDHHMFAPFKTEKGARRFMAKVGSHADDLMDIRWGDQGGKSQYPNPKGIEEGHTLDRQQDLMEQVRNKGQATSLTALAVNGSDLKEAGFKSGPQMGELLKRLTAAVVDNPSLNTKDQLLDLAHSEKTLR
jgi:tRNA nucleotidyltransferase (CCA-adding enzyme)